MKKFLLMTVAALGLCLAACSGGNAPKPTGDPAKDAQAAADYMITLMENVTDEASVNEMEKQIADLQKEFEEFYKDKKDDWAKFEEEGKKYTQSPEYQKKTEEAMKKMMEVAMKAAK